MNQNQHIYPHSNYLNAWMAYRAVSNENSIIASWMTQQSAWPQKTKITLTDIGCGDGKIVSEVIRRCKGFSPSQRISSVTLVEPHKPSLRVAAGCVRSEGSTARSVCECVRDAWKRCFSVDAVLFIHVVYLMQHGEFLGVLNRLPTGVPLYAAFDEPKSVFSKLWKETAPRYLMRAAKARATIASLSRSKYEVKSTKLISEFCRDLLKPKLTVVTFNINALLQ